MIKIDKNYQDKLKKSPYLHSEAHVLADELSKRFNDKKHFAFYLKMAVLYDHQMLRRIAGEVSEQKAKNPGALFAFLIKKNNESFVQDA